MTTARDLLQEARDYTDTYAGTGKIGRSLVERIDAFLAQPEPAAKSLRDMTEADFNDALGVKPEPSATEADIMRLAVLATNRATNVANGERPANVSEYLDDLRIAVGELVRERDALKRAAQLAEAHIAKRPQEEI